MPNWVDAIDHVNIVVSDLSVSCRFYRTVLGLEETFRRTLEGEWVDRLMGLKGVRAQCVFLEAGDGGCRLELLAFENPRTLAFDRHGTAYVLGVRHLAFTTSDFDGLLERLIETHTTLVGSPVTVPFPVGPQQLKKRLVYFHDPDGVLLEAAAYEPGQGDA